MAQKSDTLVAMVALYSESMPRARDVLASLSRAYPDSPDPAAVTGDKTKFLFPFGGNMGVVSLMPARIPWTELKGPCATAWWWPQAARYMRLHTHHLIVALMGGAGNVRERNVRLSYLVAAAARHANPAGIYWGNGTLVHEPEAFQKQVDGLTDDHLVPHLWIDMRVERNDDGTHRFFTTGMPAFSQLEIEIDRTDVDPETLLDICYAIIDWILRTGTKVRHGETVGRSADEKFRVKHERSMYPSRKTVMKLKLD